VPKGARKVPSRRLFNFKSKRLIRTMTRTIRGAVDYANQKADGGSHESDQQGNSSPVHQPRQKITTVEVRAQPMLGAGRSQPVVGKFAHAVRAEDRPENSRDSKDSQESEND